MCTMTAIPVPSNEMCYRESSGETIVLAADGSMIHVLDEMGTEIFGMFDGQRSLGDVLDLICAGWEVSREVAETDLLKFAADLVAKEIVSCRDPR